jgi:hypothetical protein
MPLNTRRPLFLSLDILLVLLVLLLSSLIEAFCIAAYFFSFFGYLAKERNKAFRVQKVAAAWSILGSLRLKSAFAYL